MDYQELISLIDKIDQSNVAYLEYTSGENKVVLSKQVPSQTASSIGIETQVTKNPIPSNSHYAPERIVLDNDEDHGLMDQPESSKGEFIKSPIVGVVYLQSQPDTEPYVGLGEEVTKGQTICIIEAMKLMNEITAPFDGIIREVLVENDSVVEFDQPLFKIEPK